MSTPLACVDAEIHYAQQIITAYPRELDEATLLRLPREHLWISRTLYDPPTHRRCLIGHVRQSERETLEEPLDLPTRYVTGAFDRLCAAQGVPKTVAWIKATIRAPK